MTKVDNPFITTAYVSPEYFCNRDKEVSVLLNAIENGRNITLFSARKYGKTGLIYHLFHKIKRNKKLNPDTVYIDIHDTSDINGFINSFSTAIVNTLESNRDKILKKITEIFSGLKVSFSINDFTGSAEIKLNLESDSEKEHSITSIFNYLNKHKKSIAIAIDEFQQINSYPEKNIEALLRKNIQHQHNIKYIFSGSEKHLLLPIFSEPNRPFYQSTQYLQLEKLDNAEYAGFIKKHFQKGGKKIEEDTINYILEWTNTHTYYTQYTCNILYSLSKKHLTLEIVKNQLLDILKERETVFYQYRKLLPYHQFQLLIAIAKENILKEPNGKYFLQKHELSGAATVRKNLNTLIEKDLVYEEIKNDQSQYQLNDVFLMRWLEWKM